MSCRCSDISTLQGQIDRLKESLSYANKANESKKDTLNALKNAADAYDEGVEFGGGEADTIAEMRKSYNTASASMDHACKIISSAIVRAQSRLSSLRSEDRHYHEEQRKKKKKHK